MTRDTKIGLLLGLVFIFIIAFLINGLPRLRGRGQGTDTRMTRIQSSSPGPGLAAKERLVREMAEQSPGMPGSPYTRVMPVGLNPQGLPGSTEIRSTMPLPGTVESQSSVASSGSNPVPTGAVPSGQPQLNGALGSAGPVTPSNGVFPAAANTVVPVRSLAPASQTTGSVGALSPAASTLPSPSATGVLAPSPVFVGGPQAVGFSQPAAPATTRVGPSEWPKT